MTTTTMMTTIRRDEEEEEPVAVSAVKFPGKGSRRGT
jgi:hypothetical protein